MHLDNAYIFIFYILGGQRTAGMITTAVTVGRKNLLSLSQSIVRILGLRTHELIAAAPLASWQVHISWCHTLAGDELLGTKSARKKRYDNNIIIAMALLAAGWLPGCNGILHSRRAFASSLSFYIWRNECNQFQNQLIFILHHPSRERE